MAAKITGTLCIVIIKLTHAVRIIMGLWFVSETAKAKVCETTPSRSSQIQSALFYGPYSAIRQQFLRRMLVNVHGLKIIF